jgi:TldD protein
MANLSATPPGFSAPSGTRSSLYRAPFSPHASSEAGASEIDVKMAEKLLGIALAKGGDYADLFFEYRAAGGFVFDEGILKSASRGVSMGLGVRVQKDDATGYAYVEQLDWDSMKRAAETAAQIATGGGAKLPVAAKAITLPRRYELDKVTLDVPGLEKRELLRRANEAAHAFDKRIIKVETSLSEEIREILMFTSDGAKRQDGSSGGGGRTTLGYFEGKTPEWHAEQAAAQAIRMLDAVEAPAGTMEVVLAPGDSGILLHEAVGHGLEADFNRKGTSNYTGQMNKQVASDLCTVIDDPSLLQSRGSINVDDEGYEPRHSTLIENGKLSAYLHDRMSANHFGISPTGNGRRESFACAPMPRMSNTILTAGPHDPTEILKSVKKGIYAKKFGGGQVDISNGDFVFNLTESYLVEDGKITAPLKGVNLIGNGPEIMRKVVMLGNDVEISDGIWTCGKDGQSVPVGVGCPTIKISAITVGGTKIG